MQGERPEIGTRAVLRDGAKCLQPNVYIQTILLENCTRARIVRMRIDDMKQWGPRLYAFAETYWTRAGMSRDAWARHHGVTPTMLLRWEDGTTVPGLPAILDIAAATETPLIDVLVVAGILDASEVGAAAPTVDAALLGDPALTDLQRRTLTEMLAALREAESAGTSARRRIKQ